MNEWLEKLKLTPEELREIQRKCVSDDFNNGGVSSELDQNVNQAIAAAQLAKLSQLIEWTDENGVKHQGHMAVVEEVDLLHPDIKPGMKTWDVVHIFKEGNDAE